MRNCAKWRALFRELLHGCLAITILVKRRLKESKKAISQGNNSAVLASIYLSAKENQINLVNRHVKILNHPPSKDSLPWEAIKLSAESVLFWKEPTVSENQTVKKKNPNEIVFKVRVTHTGTSSGVILSERSVGTKKYEKEIKRGAFSHTQHLGLYVWPGGWPFLFSTDDSLQNHKPWPSSDIFNEAWLSTSLPVIIITRKKQYSCWQMCNPFGEVKSSQKLFGKL